MARYRRILRHLWLVLALAPLPAWGGQAFIYVTNSAGDSIHVIDPATNKVVQEIKGIEAAHGIAPAPDGSRVYVSNEADSTLDVFDRESGALLKKVPLSNHPNNIAVTKNGDRILVGIARGAGAVDVIDAKTLTRTKSILVNGRLHNIYVTPDGKHLITGSIPGKLLTVIDLEREVPIWELPFDLGVRPMTIEAGDDGGIRNRRRPRHGALARDRGRARRQDAVGHQHPQQRGVRLFARRPQADRGGGAARAQAPRARRDRVGAELGDLHARQQDDLHLQRRHQIGHRHRYREQDGQGRHPGGRSAETDHHAGDELIVLGRGGSPEGSAREFAALLPPMWKTACRAAD